MITAYDAPTARLVDNSGADLILVGDSLSMVVAGNSDTSAATLKQMIYHCSIVSKIAPDKIIVGDMPRGSYEVSLEQAKENAFKLIKLGGVNAVKIEGQPKIAKALIDAGIPTMGHVGLLPQSAASQEGFTQQGKTEKSANKIFEQALALEQVGCFAIVLECITAKLARQITDQVLIPTIGIGSGKNTDGQVVVINDILGFHGCHNDKYIPGFVKQVNLSSTANKYLKEFVNQIKNNFLIKKKKIFSYIIYYKLLMF